MASETVTIEVVNWEKHNPRKDIKHPSWFRLSNTLVTDHELFDFSGDEFKAWVYFLSLASKKQAGRIIVNYEHAERSSKLNRNAIDSAIQKLVRNGSIYANVTNPKRERNGRVSLHNKTEQNRKTEGSEFADANPIPAARDLVLEEIRDPFTDPTLASVSKAVQEGWLATFADAPWVLTELKKAVTYTRANPRKTPKSPRGWSMFLTAWLNRSWEWRRKSEPASNSPINTTPTNLEAL